MSTYSVPCLLIFIFCVKLSLSFVFVFSVLHFWFIPLFSFTKVKLIVWDHIWDLSVTRLSHLQLQQEGLLEPLFFPL